jgi:RNA polymerase sigma factor (sigma-70 family)
MTVPERAICRASPVVLARDSTHFGAGLLNDWGESGPLYGEGVVDDFDGFFFEHYARVVGSLRLACGEVSEAEDAAQEAFAKAMVRWRSVSVMDRPATWVYVVAVRELRRRARRRAESISAARGGEDAALPDHAGEVVTAAVIERALRALPPRQRLAVVLRFHGDLTVSEVSRAMGCSEGTVKSTLHSAIGRLRLDLGDRGLEGAHDGP